MKTTKQFPQGLRIFPPNHKAPAWVKGSLVINKRELTEWLRTQGEEVRLDIAQSKEGDKWYASVNDYVPAPARNSPNQVNSNYYGDKTSRGEQMYDDSTGDLPF